ncbi:MAG: GIY-YIG nuclease family protein [Bdellovibrionales bacterium]|nr:GIY-YIG nuclease family protein [Bdellovibrionales bacterium]
MKIEASWSDPIILEKDKTGNLIYTLNIFDLPVEPGVYVFARRHGNKIVPIYIGETLSIRGRVKGHLNSLSLMRSIENSPNGGKFLIYCTVKSSSKERAKKHIKILEKALIIHAQSEGHELFNKQGTKLPTDSIHFTGNRTSEAIAPRVILIKKALTKPKTNSKKS